MGPGMKMPYPLLQKTIQKKKEKEKKNRNSSVSKDQLLKQMIGDRRGMKGIGDGTRAPRFSIGTYSKGTLYLSKHDIQKVTQPKRMIKDDQTVVSLARPSTKRGKGQKKGKGKKKKNKNVK